MKQILFFSALLASFLLSAQQRKLFPIEIKGKWGYMDGEGAMKIAARFDYADDFREGYAVAALNRQPCIIDPKGQLVIDTGLYMNIGPVSEGLSSVTTFAGRHAYINMKGVQVITLEAGVYDARPFNNGVAVVAKNLDLHESKFGQDIVTLGYRFGYINKAGKMLTDFIYDDADDMTGALARVKSGTKFGLINNQGKEVLPPTYFNIGVYSEGLTVYDDNGKYGYLNSNGAVAIPAKFDYAYPFSEGLAGVWVNKQYGFIDSTGELKIAAAYEAVKPFGEGRAAVKKDGKWGFVGKDGSWVIRNVFDDAAVFSEGLCAVLYKRKWGFIDAVGKVIIPTEFDAAGSFHDGVADVMYHEVNFYVNKRGLNLPQLN